MIDFSQARIVVGEDKSKTYINVSLALMGRNVLATTDEIEQNVLKSLRAKSVDLYACRFNGCEVMKGAGIVDHVQVFCLERHIQFLLSLFAPTPEAPPLFS